jgi:hypothetical protein
MSLKLVILVATALLSFDGSSLYAKASRTSSPSRVISSADLASLRSIDGLSLSPDGQRVAFQVRAPNLERNSFEVSWQVVPTSTGLKPSSLAPGGDPFIYVMPGNVSSGGFDRVPSGVWSSDSKLFAF